MLTTACSSQKEPEEIPDETETLGTETPQESETQEEEIPDSFDEFVLTDEEIALYSDPNSAEYQEMVRRVQTINKPLDLCGGYWRSHRMVEGIWYSQFLSDGTWIETSHYEVTHEGKDRFSFDNRFDFRYSPGDEHEEHFLLYMENQDRIHMFDPDPIYILTRDGEPADESSPLLGTWKWKVQWNLYTEYKFTFEFTSGRLRINYGGEHWNDYAITFNDVSIETDTEASYRRFPMAADRSYLLRYLYVLRGDKLIMYIVRDSLDRESSMQF